MLHCNPDRPVDRLHERELDVYREMSAQNDIGFAGALHYCAQQGICPPPWLVEGADKLLTELLKREKSEKRGRAAGRIARYRQDLRDFERYDSVFQIRELRRQTQENADGLAKLSKAPAEMVQRINNIRAWLSHGTFECASMSLRGGPAFGSAEAIKKSYRRVARAMRNRSAASRYHLPFGDFVFRVGLDWPGALNPGTKIVPFWHLTP